MLVQSWIVWEMHAYFCYALKVYKVVLLQFQKKAYRPKAIDKCYAQLIFFFLTVCFVCFRGNILELERLSGTDVKCYWSGQKK